MCQCKCNCKPQSSFFESEKQTAFIGFETRFEEKYLDGFKTGVHWDANWMPGGPWVYEGRIKAMRDDSKIEARQWLTGFADGLALRLKTNVHFAAWWNRNRGKVYHAPGVSIDEIRYKEPEECFPEYQQAA